MSHEICLCSGDEIVIGEICQGKVHGYKMQYLLYNATIPALTKIGLHEILCSQGSLQLLKYMNSD
jgi:hypothetical protein